MVSNKAAIIILTIGVLIGIKLNNMYVPENFEKPWQYKIFTSMFAMIASETRLASSLGFGHEATLFRRALDFYTSFTTNNDEKVTVIKTVVDGVKVVIYRPVSSQEDDKHPIMVYYHGGGYSFGNTNMYDNYLFGFVKQLNMVVISVDYRMVPENPYPIPTDDCFNVTKYVIQNPAEFRADISRLVLAGDSAGGDATAVVTMRLIKEKLHKPKIQVLIYPWTQKVYINLPSQIRYASTGILGEAKFTTSNFNIWYLGITNITEDLTRVFQENEILGLIENESERKFILDCLDVNKIPEKYKPDKSYYETQANLLKTAPKQLPETSLLRRDPQLAEKIRMMFKPELSPLLTPKETLAALPKTYMMLFEWDTLKDEGLLYAERLKEAGVDVHVAFYTEVFHGIASMTQEPIGYPKAVAMRADLFQYLQENL